MYFGVTFFTFLVFWFSEFLGYVGLYFYQIGKKKSLLNMLLSTNSIISVISGSVCGLVVLSMCPIFVFCYMSCDFLMGAAAAAAKPLQSCPTLCDPRDGSPPGSPIPGILQARTLEWVAISFSNARK